MISVLIVTHGTFAQGILDGAEMLVGKQSKVGCISLQPSDDFNLFRKVIQNYVMEADEGEGVLVLADLLGGSPYNALASSMEMENMECLTGLNMSMLLTALDQRDYCNLKQLAEECRQAAAVNIVNIRQYIAELEMDDDDD